jgi:hypothetical protein
MLRKLQPLLWVGAISGVIWLLVPYGAPNYDTLYALDWGDELAHGISPDYGAQPPTAHPLADAWGAIVSPLGATGASTATTVIAYLVLGVIAYLVYRLGALWFDRAIGALAALIVLTRPPFLSNGLRAFVDLPYVAIVLAALVLETRRPRCGWPVLALFAVAGLLRPEAWLFSAAYLGYLVLERDPSPDGRVLRRRPEPRGRALAALVALAVAAPVIWAAFDLITTGDPIHSFTATRDTAQSLGRHTGPVELITYGPRQLVQTMAWPGLIAAAVGMILGLALLRQRAKLGFAAAVLAGAAFAALASAGLAIISRYLLLGATVLCIFAATAVLGWRLLPRGDSWRRRWQLTAAALAVVFIAGAPSLYNDLSEVSEVLDDQQQISSDLHDLSDSGAFRDSCRPITVPGVQAVPRLAAWLDLRPSEMVIAGEGRQSSRGYFLVPANDVAALHYGSAEPPRRFGLIARNASWQLWSRCG